MARLPRLALAGGLHHVGLQGHSAAAVFHDDADRSTFSEMLRAAAAHQVVAIHAYALLDAQVRLLATPAQGSALGLMMQSLGRRYGAAFNRRHGRSGTLWDGRFRSSVLQASTTLVDAMVHLERLAVGQGFVEHPAEWSWSSAPHYLGHRRDAMITEHAGYWKLGNTPFERQSAHADLLQIGLSAERSLALEDALKRGHAVGDQDFIRWLAAQSSRPVEPQARGRPRMA